MTELFDAFGETIHYGDVVVGIKNPRTNTNLSYGVVEDYAVDKKFRLKCTKSDSGRITFTSLTDTFRKVVVINQTFESNMRRSLPPTEFMSLFTMYKDRVNQDWPKPKVTRPFIDKWLPKALKMFDVGGSFSVSHDHSTYHTRGTVSTVITNKIRANVLMVSIVRGDRYNSTPLAVYAPLGQSHSPQNFVIDGTPPLEHPRFIQAYEDFCIRKGYAI